MLIIYNDDYFSLYPNVLSVATLIVKELPCIKKIQFWTTISKNVNITLTVTDISNNVTKQNYNVIKTFKVLIIAKKEQFRGTNLFVQISLSRLISKLFLNSRTYL